MRKRVLSILLAVCLALALLPATALAAVSCALYVGNTLVYEYSNVITGSYISGTTYYWIEAESGDYAYAETGSASDYLFSVSFDQDSYSFTLTLNGVDISSFIQDNDDLLSMPMAFLP
ncbi:hypothetical protein SDC9_178116 [bioreactor metagenome]|uniref:Uncharacterized protein n=1 Tax=bioreactor metagenome TaxID=1076179 RepID=A0A645GV29_9ZZZZ